MWKMLLLALAKNLIGDILGDKVRAVEPFLIACKDNDYNRAGELLVEYGDVKKVLEKLPANLRAVLESPDGRAAMAAVTDAIIPEEALLDLI